MRQLDPQLMLNAFRGYILPEKSLSPVSALAEIQSLTRPENLSIKLRRLLQMSGCLRLRAKIHESLLYSILPFWEIDCTSNWRMATRLEQSRNRQYSQ